MLQNCIHEAFIERLPLYLSKLTTYKENYVSSTRLAADLSLGDVQVRKDLAKVSKAGKPKVGFLVEDLIRDINDYMGFNDQTKAVIVGMGKIGQALYLYPGFKSFNIHIVKAFDINGSYENPNGLGQYCQNHDVHVGIITVPKDHAQAICDVLVHHGVKAIWNFAPVRLDVPSHVLVQNENLAHSLSVLIKHHNDRRYHHGL